MAWCSLCKKDKATHELKFVQLCKVCHSRLSSVLNGDMNEERWLRSTRFPDATRDALDLVKQILS